MNKGKIMRRRAATLRKHLNSEIRKKEIDDEMKRSKSWEQSQAAVQDVKDGGIYRKKRGLWSLGVVVRCYGVKTKISASPPIHQ